MVWDMNFERTGEMWGWITYTHPELRKHHFFLKLHSMRRINSVFCFQVRSAATVTFSKVTVASSYTITSMDYSPIAHPTVTGTTRA